MIETVQSRDGTTIAFQRSGAGPPLVLVAGMGAANPSAWTEAGAALSGSFTLAALDRRGRGESGDGPSYSIEREGEDIAAVAGALGRPAGVLGHSYGALCALEGARLIPNLRGLILYEPLLPRPGEAVFAPGAVERIEALLAAGGREAALLGFYREVVGLDAEPVAQMRRSAHWPSRVAAAGALPREMRAAAGYRFDPRRFEHLTAPVLLVVGSDSPPALHASAETLRAGLPNARAALLPGQAHLAMYTAPALFAQTVTDFLRPA